MLDLRRTHTVSRRRDMSRELGSVELGLWDANLKITALQLTVALNMATGVDETDIHVTMLSNHFFDVRMHGDAALVSTLETKDLLSTLNEQAGIFGAALVVSRSPALLSDVNGTQLEN